MKSAKISLLVFLAVSLFIGFLFLPIRDWFMEIEGYVQSLGAIGPVVVVWLMCSAPCCLYPAARSPSAQALCSACRPVLSSSCSGRISALLVRFY